MILIDSSAWIEFLRDTNSEVCNYVDKLLGKEIAICDVINMEILAGARDEIHLKKLRNLMSTATILSISSQDYEEAAFLYRTCRRNGKTVRKLVDCLIAAVAIKNDLKVLHSDIDFDLLASETDLQIAKPT